MKRLNWILLILLLQALDCSAVDISSISHKMLASDVEWCKSDPKLGIDSVATGGCRFGKTNEKDMAKGFSDKAFWLRIPLSNSAREDAVRWLQIGNPRLQEVTLFRSTPDGKWESTESGIGTPASKRKLVETYPVLPIVLKPGESKVEYVRIHSETSIDLTPTLWLPERYSMTHQRSNILESMSLGGLLVTALLSSLLFFRQKDRLYLYFGGKLLAEATFDASFTGILPAYMWPSNLPYDIRLQAVAACLIGVFFAFFSREFIGNPKRYRKYYAVLFFFTALFILLTLLACFDNYRFAMKGVWLPALALLLSGIALFYRAWREGSRPAGYLLASISALLTIRIYLLIVLYGGDHYSESQPFGFSWYFLLIAPPILAAISQRSDAMRDALQQARADSTAKMKFLAQMSHEFRTPLNTVLGYTELLSKGSRRVSVQEATDAIRQSSRHLLEMIDGILDHVRGESGQLVLRPAPVLWESFLRGIERETSMMMKGNHFTMIKAGDQPQSVVADEFRLHEILSNLLSNANRYTRGGEITFTCEGRMDNGLTHFHFSVKDSGVGIYAHELESIFQPFVRGASGRKSGIDGTGMGLATARQLARLMGGDISVESEPGLGSKFSFSISCPVAAIAPQTVSMPDHAVSRIANRILVVEDDERSRELISMLLSDHGFSVDTANSGEDALRFKSESIDLVITDQLMENGSGWDVLGAWKNVPVILLSAIPPARPEGFPDALNFAKIHLKPLNAKKLLVDIGEILSVDWLTVETPEPGTKIPPPPAELLSPLREMIELGSVSDIDDWADSFLSSHPQYRAFASAISEANRCLDFAKLRRLTTPA
ncbi:MAG: response regulator [Burkholderiales bacterium]|nr:response regulator [Burkholderiales bacterium]